MATKLLQRVLENHIEREERERRARQYQGALMQMRNYLRDLPTIQDVAITQDPPPAPRVPHRVDLPRLSPAPVGAPEDGLEDYAALAAEVGFSTPEIQVGRLRAVLRELDLPVFDLGEVVKYMDEKSVAESKDGAGWMWRPLRARDAEMLDHQGFGNASRWEGLPPRIVPASDYYPSGDRGSLRTYDLAVPAHALRKVRDVSARIGNVAFLVSDYAPAPSFPADPFLMVVVPGARLRQGEGRFVIDFWDEPGFGLDRMLAPGGTV